MDRMRRSTLVQRALLSLSVLIGASLLAGCSSPSGNSAGSTKSTESTAVSETSEESEAAEDTAAGPSACAVDEVFERNGCLACHGADAERYGGGLNLTVAEREASLVGTASRSPGCAEEALVNVAEPEASILLHTVAAEHYAGAVESECRPIPMPLGAASTMPTEDVDCLEAWIRTLDPADDDPLDVTFAAPALSVLTRVKYLLDRGALTAEELAFASDVDGVLLPGNASLPHPSQRRLDKTCEQGPFGWDVCWRHRDIC